MDDLSEHAFPLPETAIGNVIAQNGQTGMTLRDYYAGQALIAILSKKDSLVINGQHTVAVTAFNYADSMIAERNRRRGN